MSRGVVAIVPVKRLSEVKGRLASRLSPFERAIFALESLDRVLAATMACPAIEASLVVSPDEQVRARAVAAGAEALDEAADGNVSGGGDSHNRALELARGIAAERWQPTALLVLAADLPLVVADDVSALVALGARDQSVVIAPDRRGTGTNGMFLRPPDALPFRFGVDSFRCHADDAVARGLHVEIFRSVGTAHDVDVPRDLEELRR